MSTSLHFQDGSIFKNMKYTHIFSVQKHFCLGFLLFSRASSFKKENIKWYCIVLSCLLMLCLFPRRLEILLFGNVLGLGAKV